MKITDVSHLFKWENLHKLGLSKCVYTPQYFFVAYLLGIGVSHDNSNVKYASHSEKGDAKVPGCCSLLHREKYPYLMKVKAKTH